LSLGAISEAIRLNGAAVERNLRAFEIGRWAALYPAEAAGLSRPNLVALPKTLEDKIAVRVDHLVAYQGQRLAKRYQALLARAPKEALREAMAEGYHKLLSYKDEYEVARLLQTSREKAAAEFGGDFKMTYHLAPPMLSKSGADGRPQKRALGSWLERALPALAKLKVLRGTPLDIFGYTAERRMERALIRQYEADMAEVLPLWTPETRDLIIALAELPLEIRGFGPVKAAHEAKASKKREGLLAAIRAGGAKSVQAAQ